MPKTPKRTTRKAARRRVTRRKARVYRLPKFDHRTIKAESDKPETVAEALGLPPPREQPERKRIQKTARWPANWWEAFKERWVDRYPWTGLWLLCGPVRYDSVTYWVEVDGTPVPVVTQGIVNVKLGDAVGVNGAGHIVPIRLAVPGSHPLGFAMTDSRPARSDK